MKIFKPKRIGAGYLLRWHLIPRNRFFNIYLHKFIGDDDARALHDHPWNSLSIRLKGQLWEYTSLSEIEKLKYKYNAALIVDANWVQLAPRIKYRSATMAHRIALVDKNKPAWTIFITGPTIREWGFHCRNGWQHWSTMTTKDGKQIGGCE